MRHALVRTAGRTVAARLMRVFGVSAGWKKVCPTPNFLLRYTKKETNAEMKEGQEEARELSADNYGRDEWWVLLDPVGVAEGSSS